MQDIQPQQQQQQLHQRQQQQQDPMGRTSQLLEFPPVIQQASLGNTGVVFSNMVQGGLRENYTMLKIFTGEDDVDYGWWKDEVLTYLSRNTQIYSTNWKGIEFV